MALGAATGSATLSPHSSVCLKATSDLAQPCNLVSGSGDTFDVGGRAWRNSVGFSLHLRRGCCSKFWPLPQSQPVLHCSYTCASFHTSLILTLICRLHLRSISCLWNCLQICNIIWSLLPPPDLPLLHSETEGAHCPAFLSGATSSSNLLLFLEQPALAASWKFMVWNYFLWFRCEKSLS